MPSLARARARSSLPRRSRAAALVPWPCHRRRALPRRDARHRRRTSRTSPPRPTPSQREEAHAPTHEAAALDHPATPDPWVTDRRTPLAKRRRRRRPTGPGRQPEKEGGEKEKKEVKKKLGRLRPNPLDHEKEKEAKRRSRLNQVSRPAEPFRTKPSRPASRASKPALDLEPIQQANPIR